MRGRKAGLGKWLETELTKVFRNIIHCSQTNPCWEDNGFTGSVPGMDQAIIKPVAYFKAILENAGKKKIYEHVPIEKLMDSE